MLVVSTALAVACGRAGYGARGSGDPIEDAFAEFPPDAGGDAQEAGFDGDDASADGDGEDADDLCPPEVVAGCEDGLDCTEDRCVEGECVHVGTGDYTVRYVCDVAALVPGFLGCFADVYNDGLVRGSDRGAIYVNWGSTDDPTVCVHDLNGDGHIESADVDVINAHIGDSVDAGTCDLLPAFQDPALLAFLGAVDPRFVECLP